MASFPHHRCASEHTSDLPTEASPCPREDADETPLITFCMRSVLLSLPTTGLSVIVKESQRFLKT
jgi:hypothetical protein